MTVRQKSAGATMPPVRRQAVEQPLWPLWLHETAAACIERRAECGVQGMGLRWFDSPCCAVVRARVARAGALDDGDFQAATVAAYGEIARLVQKQSARHIARFWNYLPDIQRPCGNGMDRYMVFNAGRFEACRRWLGGDEGDHSQWIPTASGVGHRGEDLVIDALATDAPGRAVENPRQISAYQYSRRYGPRPPVFARAVEIQWPQAGARLLVGGTASVRGEDSVHAGDVHAQIGETLENLTALARTAAAGRRWQFSDLRVYHPQVGHAAEIGMAVRQWAAGVAGARIEMMIADLCRPELLVEIEGVARLAS